MVQNLHFTFNAPIFESATVDSDFIIKGTAINQTVTSNNHKFLSEELRPAADTLTGCPLLVDHENKVENIKGRVIKGIFNEADKKIDFSAKVMDKTCQEMIKDGRLNSVSVGATVKDVESAEDGTLIPRGIEFKELSLVAVPADSNATFQIAMKEAYNSQVTIDEKMMAECKECGYKAKEMPSDKVCPKCGKSMSMISKDKLDNLIVMKGGNEMVEKIETPSEKVKEAVEDKTALVEAKDKELKELIEANKKLSEQIVALTPKAKIKNEFDETEDVRENYKIVQGHKEFSVIMNKY